jgi:hypothetical protein
MKEKDDPSRAAAATRSTPASPVASANADQAKDNSELLGWNYAVLLYPFFHRLGTARREVLQQADSQWHHWLMRLEHEDLGAALDDTYFFLPHVREILFPETSLLDGHESVDSPAARLREILDTSLLAVTGDGPPAGLPAGLPSPEKRRGCFERGMLRITLKENELRRFTPLKMKKPTDPEGSEIPLHIEWIDVALFPHGIGLLMLKVSVPVGEIREIVRAFEYARHVFEPQTSFKPVELVNHMPNTAWKDWRTLVEYLLRDFVTPHGDRFRQEDYTLSSEAQVYGEVFRQLIAVAQPESSISSSNSPQAGPFASPSERWLHDLIIGHDSSDPDWTPAAERINDFRARSTLSYWRDWRAGCDWGNLAFLLESGTFVNHIVRYNIEYDYLPLFMLATFQQIRLQKFAGEVISKAREPRTSAAEAAGLWAALMQFRNQYWFREVSTKPLGADLYRLLWRSLDLEGIQRTVVTELDALRAFWQDLRIEDRRLTERRVTLAAAVVTLLFSLQVMLFLFPQAPVTWTFLPTPNEALARWISVGLLAAWAVVIWMLFAWPRRSNRQRSGEGFGPPLTRDDHHARR